MAHLLGAEGSKSAKGCIAGVFWGSRSRRPHHGEVTVDGLDVGVQKLHFWGVWCSDKVC
jgi:hypothetical protein